MSNDEIFRLRQDVHRNTMVLHSLNIALEDIMALLAWKLGANSASPIANNLDAKDLVVAVYSFRNAIRDGRYAQRHEQDGHAEVMEATK